jgi:hypothetical protein
MSYLPVIIEGLIFFAALFKIYTDLQVKLKEIEVRLHSVEKQDDEIYYKLEKIMEGLNDIKIQMKDKADR